MGKRTNNGQFRRPCLPDPNEDRSTINRMVGFLPRVPWFGERRMGNTYAFNHQLHVVATHTCTLSRTAACTMHVPSHCHGCSQLQPGLDAMAMLHCRQSSLGRHMLGTPCQPLSPLPHSTHVLADACWLTAERICHTWRCPIGQRGGGRVRPACMQRTTTTTTT